jgi:chemotaxis signal transduction protein
MKQSMVTSTSLTTPDRARPPAPPAADEPQRSFCSFCLGEAVYGIDIRLLRDVNAVPPVTRIPHAPEGVRGYVNLRGQIQLVLDLRVLLGLEPTVIGPETRLILFQPALGDPFGVLVDRIGDIVTLTEDRIEERRKAETIDDGTAQEELIEGFGKLEKELLNIVDAQKLLPRIERLVKA